MVFIFAALVVLVAVEVYRLFKKGEVKEAVLNIVFGVLTFAFGLYVTLNPFYHSLSHVILTALGYQVK